MNILIVMAGDGKRFLGSKYNTIKPLIEIKNKSILQWTTESLPFIKHYKNNSIKNLSYDIAFAIRTEHDKKYNLSNKLRSIYGDNVKIQMFDEITRGNLETAYISTKNLFDKSEDELLILDSDNHYNGNNFLFYKNYFSNLCKTNFGMICCFYPKNKEEKWCFAKFNEGNEIISLHEKVYVENSYPMVGVFYFKNTQMFLSVSKEILDSEEKIKNEFYMSQSIQKLLYKKIPVYGIIVSNVIPLGTPKDIDEYAKFLN